MALNWPLTGDLANSIFETFTITARHKFPQISSKHALQSTVVLVERSKKRLRQPNLPLQSLQSIIVSRCTSDSRILLATSEGSRKPLDPSE
jgi:hypothetical protein